MKIIKFLAVIILITVLSSCNNQGVTKKELKSDVDTVSYVIGLDMAFKLKQNFSEVDEDLFAADQRDPGVDHRRELTSHHRQFRLLDSGSHPGDRQFGLEHRGPRSFDRDRAFP